MPALRHRRRGCRPWALPARRDPAGVEQGVRVKPSTCGDAQRFKASSYKTRLGFVDLMQPFVVCMRRKEIFALGA